MPSSPSARARVASVDPAGEPASADAAAEGNSEARLAPTDVLIVSRDPAQRQSLVLTLGGFDELTVSSAAGFHMAVPMLWASSVDVVVVGALAPEDLARLTELRHHARGASLLVLGGLGTHHAAANPEGEAVNESELVQLLARLRPALA